MEHLESDIGPGEGYGCGYGHGYSYGSGVGHGDGYGNVVGVYGRGDGDGLGYAHGDGEGCGDSYAYGYGYSCGLGYGRDYVDSHYGNGNGDYSGPVSNARDGSGTGYGDHVEYWAKAIDVFASRWTQEWRARLAAARAQGAVIAYWRSGADGRPCNGGRGKPVRVGKMQRVAGPLRLCSDGALHATLLPPDYAGKRCWIVALYGPTEWLGDKIGALRREILGVAA